MLLGMKTRVGRKNHVLKGVQIPQGELAIFGVVRPIEKAL